MPTRTKGQAPAGRVYKSTLVAEQIQFPTRRRTIKYRRSTGSTTTSRQETLTQMEFTSLLHKNALDLIEADLEQTSEFEVQEKTRKAKRRKTEEFPPSSSHHTQTLTQIDFILLRSSGDKSDDDGKATHDIPLDASRSGPTTKDDRTCQQMPPPMTPKILRVYEIPSSQSPAESPFSTRNSRSPLKTVNMNSVPRIRFEPSTKITKLEIKDSLDTSDESQLMPIPSTPAKISSPEKTVRFMDQSLSLASPTIKRALIIEDSEAETDTDDVPFCAQSRSDHAICQNSDMGESRHESAKSSHLFSPPHPDIPMRAHNKEDSKSNSILEAKSERVVTSPLDETHSMIPHSLLEIQSVPIGANSTLVQPPFDQETARWSSSHFTQGLRLSTQQIDIMAPRTQDSDIFVSIHPVAMEKLIDGSNTYDTRHFTLPDTVCRVWFYETRPASRVRYMASIGNAEIIGKGTTLDEDKNTASNRANRFAYEILQIFELADPLPLRILKSNAWIETPPKKYSKVRPAVLDALMANLRRDPLVGHDISQGTDRDTEAATEQLHNTMMQFGHTNSSELQTPVNSKVQNIRSSQATTMDLTQLSTAEETRGSTHENYAIILESSANFQPPDSSPALPHTNLEKATVSPLWRQHAIQSSSQLLTKSQMLPDSLLNESIPPPPAFDFIGDSEDDDEL